ncbi:MAG: coenzyme F420-0:L-glutamate ligase [Dehalococcoidia bacterium]|nr:MAG: coenzyme F420-0:L-glutamate ligase [Dehalococcoidia bacterium]
MAAPELRVIGLGGLPEVRPGDDIAALILEAAERQGIRLRRTGDVLVVTQKIVSKAEERVVALADVEPGPEAARLAQETEKDPRVVELILRESRRIVRQAGPVLITETRHGFVCANAGVDASNVGQGLVTLLPEDPDRSAGEIRAGLREGAGLEVAVVISDTFGRPGREGHTNGAGGIAGMEAFVDYVGRMDPYGYELRVSTLAVADELAGAAELVMGKLSGVPAAIVRGYAYPKGSGTARDMIRPAERDLFR